MMSMAGQGQAGREGTRMGLWGAAQGIAFGLGGFGGTVLFDVARLVVASPATAYALVFGLEAALFVLAAVLALRIEAPRRDGAVKATTHDDFAGRPRPAASIIEGRLLNA